MRALALGVLLALVASAPASAQERRLQVEAAVPAGGRAAAGASPRRAAIEAAIAEAVGRVARELLGERLLSAAPGEGARALAATLGDDPLRFTERYRVVEDLGERPAPAAPGVEDPREYAVRVEVGVDVGRVAARLRELGHDLEAAGGGSATAFPVVLRPLPSWVAYEALRRHLLDAGLARSAVPVRFEAGEAVLRVEAPGGPSALLARLRADPPEGVGIEPLAVAEDGLALFLRPAPGAEGASGPPAD